MYRNTSAAAMLLLLNTGVATAEPVIAPRVPASIQAGSNESLVLVAPAQGVQIYECRASAARPGAYEWAFVAPDAELFDRQGRNIGRHYAGPHWELDDGSKVVASVKARADAPQAEAIPWLLLSARSVGPEGLLSKVSSIQRTNTVGGKAPLTGCSQATAGTSARVRYTAHYYFFRNGD